MHRQLQIALGYHFVIDKRLQLILWRASSFDSNLLQWLDVSEDTSRLSLDDQQIRAYNFNDFRWKL